MVAAPPLEMTLATRYEKDQNWASHLQNYLCSCTHCRIGNVGSIEAVVLQGKHVEAVEGAQDKERSIQEEEGGGGSMWRGWCFFFYWCQMICPCSVAFDSSVKLYITVCFEYC